MVDLKAAVSFSRQVAWGGQHVPQKCCFLHWCSLQFSQLLNKTGGKGKSTGRYQLSEFLHVKHPLGYFIDLWTPSCSKDQDEENSANVVSLFSSSFHETHSWKLISLCFCRFVVLQQCVELDLGRSVRHNEGEDPSCTPEVNGFFNGASSCRQAIVC